MIKVKDEFIRKGGSTIVVVREINDDTIVYVEKQYMTIKKASVQRFKELYEPLVTEVELKDLENAHVSLMNAIKELDEIHEEASARRIKFDNELRQKQKEISDLINDGKNRIVYLIRYSFNYGYESEQCEVFVTPDEKKAKAWCEKFNAILDKWQPLIEKALYNDNPDCGLINRAEYLDYGYADYKEIEFRKYSKL